MAKINNLLTERLSKSDKSPKMKSMSSRSASSGLTSFSGVFAVGELSASEKEKIEAILDQYSDDDADLGDDLETLYSITSEVKAITNQAALLHGERIKKAHAILTRYRDGAFTAWLLAAYGNRQTPYNFMQYYDFIQVMPQSLRPRIEQMPRQAIYTLASRDGESEKKKEIIERYEGESKQVLLHLIRETFPLSEADRRRQNHGDSAIKNLSEAFSSLKRAGNELTEGQREEVCQLVEEIAEIIESL